MKAYAFRLYAYADQDASCRKVSELFQYLDRRRRALSPSGNYSCVKIVAVILIVGPMPQ